MNNRTLSLIPLLAIAQIAVAQVNLTSRESTLTCNYVYGFGGDTHSANLESIETALVPSDNNELAYHGATSGNWVGSYPYSGEVQATLTNQYATFGPSADLNAIAYSGNSSVTGLYTGFGVGLMGAQNPGNRQTFYFTVTNSPSYRFRGNLTHPADGSGFVALQRFDGVTWAQVWYSYTLPGFQGDFNTSGEMIPGSYRVISEAACRAGNGTPAAGVAASYWGILRIGNRVTGSINLQDYVGGVRPITFTIEKGTQTDTQVVDVDPATGTYEFYTHIGGQATIRAKGGTWLRQSATATLGLNAANFNLKNGNCNGDTVVDLSDYTIVATAFNALPSSANWNITADLNRDNVVDLTDYTIVAVNFNSLDD